jgi:CDP-diacylglycerol--glycerol-3-phosphate 3-phosphatidyltransferase/cardiolipin synthase
MLSGNPPSASFAQLPLWFVMLVISRDIVLIAGFLLINHIKGSVVVKSRIPGKSATFFQAMLIMIILVKVKDLPFEICLYTASAFTLFSAVQYGIDGYHQLEDVQPR